MSGGAEYMVRLIDGVLYDPWAPRGAAPSPETVAWGLAALNRYGGHTRRPYSVAEHCAWVALRLALGDGPLFREAGAAVVDGDTRHLRGILRDIPARERRLAFLGLVHDAPEGCGLVDVPWPVGRRAEMAEYRMAHDRCLEWLLRGWGVQLPSGEERAAVKEVDRSILGAELALRPQNADEKIGSGEDLSPWEGIDLLRDDPAEFCGPHCVRDLWSELFGVLLGEESVQ